MQHNIFISELKLCILILPPATKLGQGYVFTHVCDSVHRGGSASVHAGIHHTPRPETPPQPDQTRPPSGPDTSPDQTPGAVHARRYGRATSGRYASYWNAYLYNYHLICFKLDISSLLYNDILLLNAKNKNKKTQKKPVLRKCVVLPW